MISEYWCKALDSKLMENQLPWRNRILNLILISAAVAASVLHRLMIPLPLPVDELDGIFRSNVNIHKSGQSQNYFGDDDMFRGTVSGSGQYGAIDLESMFNSSNFGNSDGGFRSNNSVGFDAFDDFPGANTKKSDPVGNFGVNSIGKSEEMGSGFDDLIPGFGGANSLKNGFILN